MTCSKGRRVAALILVHVLPGELQGPPTQTVLCGTTFQSQPACFSNLQAATAAIDLAKFTELNKRLTPFAVNGKRGHSQKLYGL